MRKRQKQLHRIDDIHKPKPFLRFRLRVVIAFFHYMYACLSGVLYDPRKRRRKPCHHRLSIRSARFVRSPSARPPGIRWDGSRRFFVIGICRLLRRRICGQKRRKFRLDLQRTCHRDQQAVSGIGQFQPGLAALEQLPAGIFFRTDIVRAEQQPDLSGLIGTACQIDQPAVLRRWFLSHVCCLPFLRDRRVLSIPAKPYKAGRRVLCGIAYTIISQFCGNCKPAKGVAGQNGNMHKIHSRFPLKIEKKLRISA